MKTSPETNEIFDALSRFAEKLPMVPKLHTGKIEGVSRQTGKPYSYEYSYSDLGDSVEAAKPLLAEFGLAVTQLVGWKNGHDVLTTRVVHKSGQWFEDTARLIVPDNATPQVAGSAITYLRRYAYTAALGIVADTDDDGQLAQMAYGEGSGRRRKPPRSSTPTERPQSRRIAADPATAGVEFATSQQRNKIIGHLARNLEPPILEPEAVLAYVQTLIEHEDLDALVHLTRVTRRSCSRSWGSTRERAQRAPPHPRHPRRLRLTADQADDGAARLPRHRGLREGHHLADQPEPCRRVAHESTRCAVSAEPRKPGSARLAPRAPHPREGATPLPVLHHHAGREAHDRTAQGSWALRGASRYVAGSAAGLVGGGGVTEELCGAVIVAGRLMDAIGVSGLSADMERPEPGLHMLHCVLPKGHHLWAPGVNPHNCNVCGRYADSQMHGPGHMLDQSLFLPPEPPKCGARWFVGEMGIRKRWIDGSWPAGPIECILDRGHAGGHDSGLVEWR